MRKIATLAAIYTFTIMGFICIATIFAIIICGLIYSAIHAGIAAVFSSLSAVWSPTEGSYGIMPMITGTFCVAIFATALASALAFGVSYCVWVYDGIIGGLLRSLLRFMAGIPTVVYGLCGLIILIPLFRNVWGGSGYNLAIVSVILSLMILPTIVLIIDSSLSSKKDIMFTAISLGMSREKAFIYAVFIPQKKQVLSAILQGFSRAIGDTLIALMLSGNTPIMPDGVFSSMRTLSGHISLLTATEITPQIEFTLFLSGFLLFAISFMINISAKILWKSK